MESSDKKPDGEHLQPPMPAPSGAGETPKEEISGEKATKGHHQIQPPAGNNNERVGSRWFWFQRDWLNDTKIRFATITLSILTFTVAVFVFRETKEQVRIADDAVGLTEQALEFQKKSDSLNRIEQKAIADSSIALSKTIAATQERFAKVEVRSYVSFDGVDNHSFVVGKQMKAIVKLLNSGKTPAYNVVSRSEIKTGTGVYPHERDSLMVPREGLPGGVVLGAGQSYGVEASGKVFRPIDSIGVFSGKYLLFVHGRITYKDKFGSPHFTNYCVFYRLRDKSFINYKQWNDAD